MFAGFGLLALLAAAGLVVAVGLARRLGHPERAWAAVRNGAWALVIGVVIAGVVAFFAFDAAFEVFHRLFLVQLFPFAFWSETTMAVGAVIVGLSLVVAVVAGRLAQRRASPAEAAAAAASRAHPEAAR